MQPHQPIAATAKWVIEIELPEAFSQAQAQDALDRLRDSCVLRKDVKVSLSVKHTASVST